MSFSYQKVKSPKSAGEATRTTCSLKWILLCTLAIVCFLSLLSLQLWLNYHDLWYLSDSDFDPDYALAFQPLPQDEAAERIPIQEDIPHLTYQYDACMNYKESVILGSCKQANVNDSSCLFDKTDPHLAQKIGACPAVDVYIPTTLRGHGYCQDAVAYAKFLNSRLLPRWVFDVEMKSTSGRNVTYFDLCPETPVIVMNHYHDNIFDIPGWKALGRRRKPIYLMPNIEMYELRYEDFTRADVVLCKTKVCYQRVSQLFKQEGNPNNTSVLYTKHASTDPSTLSLDNHNSRSFKFVDKKLFFVHTPGSSGFKGTAAIVDCWLSRLHLPPLYIYIQENHYREHYSHLKLDTRLNQSSMHFHTGMLNDSDYANLLLQAPVILCPSVMEGYGHYINQARASESLILTTNLPPMNELVSAETGVLANIKRIFDSNQLLGGTFTGPHGLKHVPGLRGEINGGDVCNAVDEIVKMSASSRTDKARAARQAYLEDTRFFRRKMNELKALVVWKRTKRLSQ